MNAVEMLRKPGLLSSNNLDDPFGGDITLRNLRCVQFLEDEVRHWLPRPPSAAITAPAGKEPKPRGPKPKWDWTAIVARATMEYWSERQRAREMAWKVLRERIRDLAQHENGRRPGETVAGERASTIIRVVNESGNSLE